MSIWGAVAAVVVGYFTGWNPQAMALAYSVAAGVDAYANAPDQVGPRLGDLDTQVSTYGAPIPIEWGCNRHAGCVIWPKVLRAVEHQHAESSKGGPDVITFTYTMSFAVLMCEGPIAGVRRIWANKKLVYDVSVEGGTETRDPSINGMRIYLGTEDQESDVLMEALDGPSPAYRGYAYIMFESYDVTELQGRVPMFEFEIVKNGSDDFAPELTLLDEIPAGTGGLQNYQSTYDFDNRRLWVHNGTKASTSATTGGDNDHSCINVYDLAERELVTIISPGEDRDYGDLVYATEALGVYAGGEYIDSFGVDDTNGATHFNSSTYVDSALLRTTHMPGVFFPARPGRLARLGGPHGIAGLDYLTATSSSGVGSGISFWFFISGVYSQTGDVEGWWKNQVIGCKYGRFAMITDDVSGGGGLLMMRSNYTVIAPVFHPMSEFDGELPLFIAEDAERERLVVCAGSKAYTLQMDDTNDEGDVITEFYDSAIGNITCCAYDDRSDRIYLLSGSTIISIDSYDLSYINSFDTVGMGEIPREIFISPVDGEIVLIGPTSVWLLSGMYTSVTPGPVPLSTIVSDICERAGLTTGDIDVTDLEDDLVDGFVVGRQMTARAAIEPLQPAFQFDAVESDDKIKFVKRNNATVTTILEDERAAHEYGSDVPDALSITRAFDLELPFQCEVEYPDIDADHLIGTQYERRLTKESKQKLTVAMPIVMTAERAQQIARILLYESWLNESFSWTTSCKYAHLEPTDKVSLPTEASSYTARITSKREQPNGVIEWEGALVSLEVYDQSGEGSTPTDYVPQTIYAPGDTTLKLIDTAMLRDADDNAGPYIAMGGVDPSWYGAQLFRSTDGGTNYDGLFSMANEATIGRALTVLSDFTAGNIFDEGSTVDVLVDTGGELISVTEDQTLSGYNKAVIGAHGRWEVVHFKNAELIDTDTYRLSGFLRGCRGTEWANGTHFIGDSFVLASTAAWNRISDSASDIGLTRLYKAPPARVRLDAVVPVEFVNTAAALKPFSPVDAVGTRDGSNNLSVTFARRTRLAAGTLHLAVLLGEAVEAYEIDIMDGDDVLRTIASSTQTFGYLASEQTTDGLTPGDPVTARIYQIGALERGYPLEITL
jgi:hypothetical protein